MSQNWTNKDGLFIQYGTDQTTTELAGDFATPGTPNRIMEVYLDLSTLVTASATILSNNVIFPAPPSGQLFIEKVELYVETGATSGSSSTLKVGLIQMDRATVPSNYDHAFINGETNADMATAGDVLLYVGADSIPAGSTHGGILIGSQPANATGPYYITAEAGTAVFTAGKVRVRIFYRGIGTITQ